MEFSKIKICLMRIAKFASKTKIFMFQKQKSTVCEIKVWHEEKFLVLKDEGLPCPVGYNDIILLFSTNRDSVFSVLSLCAPRGNIDYCFM